MGRLTLAALALGLLSPQLAFAQSGAGAAPPPGPAPAPSATDAPPPSGTKPPNQYYMEPPGGAAENGPPPGPQQGPPPGYYEPPPPGYYGPPTVWEPPPPPKPHHNAPKTAFWLGGRVGWFVPFGSLWLRNTPQGYDEVKWTEYGSAGPMFEGDVGMRFSRYYNVFLLWERASLGAGSADPIGHGGQNSGETDYYAIGLRFSSDADRVGFLTEIDLGYRRFRARWADGTELQLTQAPLEFRIGLGADIRVSPAFSLSPMLTLGAGAFGSAEWVAPNGVHTDAQATGDQGAGHGWLTLQLGAHFDLPPGNGD